MDYRRLNCVYRGSNLQGFFDCLAQPYFAYVVQTPFGGTVPENTSIFCNQGNNVDKVTVDRVQAILETAHDSQSEIAVLGDVMLDKYYWGTVHRVSPEAPVPVVDLERSSYHLGGAANVAANIRGLKYNAVLFGVVGSDSEGRMLRDIAQAEGMDPDCIIEVDNRPTTVKTRVIGNNQQLLRLDTEVRSEVPATVIEPILQRLASRPHLAGIVLEDYDKGFLSDNLIAAVNTFAFENSIPVFVDPKRRTTSAYTGVYVFQPNRKEASDLVRFELTTQADVIRAGTILQEQIHCENVLITLGAEGMMLFEPGGVVSSVPTMAQYVADVSGAGDTTIATLAVMNAGGATIKEAAAVANLAAGVVVSQPGIVAITTEMLLQAVYENHRYRSEHS